MRAFTLRRNTYLPHLTILQGNGCSIAQKSGEIVTVQLNLQPISLKSDRLLTPQFTPTSGRLRRTPRHKPQAPYSSIIDGKPPIRAYRDAPFKNMPYLDDDFIQNFIFYGLLSTHLLVAAPLQLRMVSSTIPQPLAHLLHFHHHLRQQF